MGVLFGEDEDQGLLVLSTGDMVKFSCMTSTKFLRYSYLIILYFSNFFKAEVHHVCSLNKINEYIRKIIKQNASRT